MYVNGQGVLQDYAQTHMWLRKGAEQGNSLAQTNLGFLYESGKGVPASSRHSSDTAAAASRR